MRHSLSTKAVAGLTRGSLTRSVFSRVPLWAREARHKVNIVTLGSTWQSRPTTHAGDLQHLVVKKYSVDSP